jgi:hypothetical protein
MIATSNDIDNGMATTLEWDQINIYLLMKDSLLKTKKPILPNDFNIKSIERKERVKIDFVDKRFIFTFCPVLLDRFRRTKYWNKTTTWEIKYIITNSFRILLYTKAPPKHENKILVFYSLKSVLTPGLNESDIIKGYIDEIKFNEILSDFTNEQTAISDKISN